MIRPQGGAGRRDGDLRDLVQGEVTVANSELDDLILLRADGTPTYNLSVVVDDHDMGISHVIRGDDHLRNAFRQTQIYRAAGWDVPEFAHIPLIHDAAGLKMSKRRGTVAVDAYRDLGYLPEGLRNYLLRLGWSHGDDEIITLDDAGKWFSLDAVGRAPSRFDQPKLDSVNAHYLKEADDARLVGLLGAVRRTTRRRRATASACCVRMPGLKPRAKTVAELAEKAAFLRRAAPCVPAPDAAQLLTGETRQRCSAASPARSAPRIGATKPSKGLSETSPRPTGLKLGAVAQPLRAALTGSTASPGIFEVMEVLGRDECLGRLADAA